MLNMNGCSELVQMLATVGGVVIYAVIGAFIGWIVYQLVRGCDEDSRAILIALGMVFWPIAIVMILIYMVAWWIAMPLLAATRSELRDTEERLSDRIDSLSSSAGSDSKVEYSYYGATFKVGDIITGVVPQTDYNGNNISYDHLYQGCKCRVLSIDDDDSMKVILIDHKDRSAHESVIGKTFTAPARNFTLVKKSYKKRKAVKSKKSKK